jgi:hypothetical protein
MGSLKGAGVFGGAILLLVPVVSWVVDRAGELAASGSALSLVWRVAIAATSWYVRFLPFLTFGGIALAALIGGYLSRQSPVAHERRALLGWLILAVPDMALPFVAPLIPSLGDHVRDMWLNGLMVLMAVTIVAPLAAIVMGARIQERLRVSLSSRVRGWHIVVASLVLALLGPALLVPPVWVWVRSRNGGHGPTAA